jgi:hypothetical protein
MNDDIILRNIGTRIAIHLETPAVRRWAKKHLTVRSDQWVAKDAFEVERCVAPNLVRLAEHHGFSVSPPSPEAVAASVYDITLHDTGPLVGLNMRSQEALTWAKENLDAAGGEWLSRTLWIKPNEAPNLVQWTRRDGFSVSPPWPPRS